MSNAADLPMMHLLLRQGRLPAVLSLGLLLVALLLLSVAMGVAQAYYAVRVQLDASLLQLLLREHLQGDAAAARVDAALHAAGLRRRDAQAPMRGWDARWIGMRRLLVRQYVATLLQFSVLLLAVLWPQT